MLNFGTIKHISSAENTVSVEIKHSSAYTSQQDNTESTQLMNAFEQIGYQFIDCFFKHGDDSVEVLEFNPKQDTTPIDTDSIKKQLNIVVDQQYTGIAWTLLSLSVLIAPVIVIKGAQ